MNDLIPSSPVSRTVTALVRRIFSVCAAAAERITTGAESRNSARNGVLPRRSWRYYPSVNAAYPLSANIKACGLCQFPLAVVKGPKSLYIEFESAGDVQAVERADAEFGSIPSAEIATYL